MSKTVCQAEQLTFFEVGRREVTVAFDEGDVVTDTGLLAVRKLDQELGVLAEAAARLPDPEVAGPPAGGARSQTWRAGGTAQVTRVPLHPFTSRFPS